MAQSQSDTSVERLPDHMKAPALGYIDRGKRPGGFLEAVLSNDFQEAVTRADTTNEKALRDWAMWLFNDIPPAAWGSPEAVEDWIEQGGKSGR